MIGCVTWLICNLILAPTTVSYIVAACLYAYVHRACSCIYVSVFSACGAYGASHSGLRGHRHGATPHNAGTVGDQLQPNEHGPDNRQKPPANRAFDTS